MTTKADLDYAFAAFVAECELCGIHPTVSDGLHGPKIPGRWVLQEGSRYYGRAFRLYWTPEDPAKGGGLTTPDCFGSYLGMTKREATGTLQGYQTGLYGARVYGRLGRSHVQPL